MNHFQTKTHFTLIKYFITNVVCTCMYVLYPCIEHADFVFVTGKRDLKYR
jgi:hypothetical protein